MYIAIAGFPCNINTVFFGATRFISPSNVACLPRGRR